jgi:hypothetical protein
VSARAGVCGAVERAYSSSWKPSQAGQDEIGHEDVGHEDRHEKKRRLLRRDDD